MRGMIVAVAMLALAGIAVAQERRDGWSIQFQQDTFDKSVFPLAILSQDGDAFDKAMIAFACGQSRDLIAFFQPEQFMMFAESSKAQFRDGGSTKEFTFDAGEVPHFGRRLIVSPDDSAKLVTIFETADGSDVAFRTDKKQGVFTSIGAKEAFAIMRAHCNGTGG